MRDCEDQRDQHQHERQAAPPTAARATPYPTSGTASHPFGRMESPYRGVDDLTDETYMERTTLSS